MISDLRPILERFLALNSVTLALIAGSDGLVIESVSNHDYDIDAIAAVATTGLGASQVMAREVAKGELIQSIIEFEHGLVLLEPIGELAILLVLTSSPSSIGQVRLLARRERAAMRQAIES